MPSKLPQRDDSEYASLYDRLVVPFARDQSLWPITLIVLGHASVFIAPVMLWVWRDSSGNAWTTLLALVAATVAVAVYDLRRRGGFADASGLALASWALGGAVAWLANAYEIF